MHTSCEGFACGECGGHMEQVRDVPVLQSLQDHVIHRCIACGHLVLVQEDPLEDRSAGWLTSLLIEMNPGITCVAMV